MLTASIVIIASCLSVLIGDFYEVYDKIYPNRIKITWIIQLLFGVAAALLIEIINK